MTRVYMTDRQTNELPYHERMMIREKERKERIELLKREHQEREM